MISKKLSFVLILFLFQNLFHADVFSQNISVKEKYEIQQKARRVPKKFAKNPTTLAVKLTKGYSDDARKVIALTYWIAKNIKYDYNAYLNKAIYRQSSEKVLKRKKALCGEYASLFNQMCEAVGVSSFSVSGYTKDFDFTKDDNFYRAEHAWSVVKIKDTWELMDITWGSGYLKTKKQVIPRLLYTLFEIPFQVKKKYVHEYNPYWFYVSPKQMIGSHYPVLDEFQLLENPVGVDDFIVGGDHLKDLVWYQNDVKINNIQIPRYSKMGAQRQFAYKGVEGVKHNAYNHRVKGFNDYLAAVDLFERYYDYSVRAFDFSARQKKKMSDLLLSSESLIRESILDNTIEYKVYADRSEGWKNKLVDKNKEYVAQINDRLKLNKKQSSLVAKTQRDNEKDIAYAIKNRNYFNKKSISNTRRPTEKSKLKDSISELVVCLIDSLESVNNKLIEVKNNLLNKYLKDEHDSFMEIESVNASNYMFNHKQLKKQVRKKSFLMPWIYFNEEPLLKSWYKHKFDFADSTNKKEVNPYLEHLYAFQDSSSILMKAFFKNNKLMLKLIKKRKKNSFKNSGEVGQFVELVRDHKREFEVYNSQLSSYLWYSNSFLNTFKKEDKLLVKTKEQFKKDSKLENYRHDIYTNYRRSIRLGEDNRMKSVLRSLNFIRRKLNPELEDENEKKKKSYYVNKSIKSKSSLPSVNEDVPSSNETAELKFLSLLNNERIERGLNPLTIDNDLSRAARYHSYEMGKEDFFEHASYKRNRGNNQLEYVCNTFERIWRFDMSNSENIAAGMDSGAAVYDSWYNSPAHNKNMFNPAHKVIGIGYVRVEGSKYTHYWTTDFR